jgi:predicted nucleic acid-binding protein
MRRGFLDQRQGEQMVANTRRLLVEAVPAAELCDVAFRLAAEHGFSAYDAAYVALAKARGIQVLTADLKLFERAVAAGIGSLVRALAPD